MQSPNAESMKENIKIVRYCVKNSIGNIIFFKMFIMSVLLHVCLNPLTSNSLSITIFFFLYYAHILKARIKCFSAYHVLEIMLRNMNLLSHLILNLFCETSCCHWPVKTFHTPRGSHVRLAASLWCFGRW